MTQPTPTPEPPAPRSPADRDTQQIAAAPVGATASSTHQLSRVEADPPAEGVQPTGPVGSLPGPPATGPAPPAGAARPRRRATGPPRRGRTPRRPRPPRSPQECTTRVGSGLVAVSFLLLQLGLGLGFGEAPLWSAVTLWSAFATLATLLGALPFAGRPLVPAAWPDADAAWTVAAGGLTGTAVFWVLVVLPRVDSDRGFVLTAALAALGAALWIAPGRARG